MTDVSEPWRPGTDPAAWLRAAIDRGLVRSFVVPAIEEVIGEVNELLERLADNTLLVERTQLHDEVGRLRQEIVDARGEATAAEIERDVAQAERDQAREIARNALHVINDEYGFKELRHTLDEPGWTIPGLDAENYPAWLIGHATTEGDAA